MARRNGFFEAAKGLDKVAASLIFTGPALIAEKTVKELQERGPVWTGKFANSWQITGPQGQLVAGTGSPGEPKPLTAPTFTGQQATQTLTRLAILKDKVVYTVSNFSPYFKQAIDAEPFDYSSIPDTGLPDPLNTKSLRYGVRPQGGTRGELTGGGRQNRSSAPADWFSVYAKGGFIDKSVKLIMDQVTRGLK